MRSASRIAVLTLLILLAGAPAAQAGTQRWASAAPQDPNGACLSMSPCSLQHAIEDAGGSDEVIVTPGTYAVSSPIVLDQAIAVHGLAGEPPPRIVGAGNLALSTISIEAEATVRHLAVEASGAGADALTIKEGAVVEGVTLTAAAGDGAKLVGDPDGTVLRDSVVVSRAPGSSAAALKLRDGPGGGTIALRNVTAYATAGSATGIRCETNAGSSTLVNVLTRGAAHDVHAATAGADCLAEHSNLRSAASPGVIAGERNHSDEPLLRNAAAGDFRPIAGSPTIDAGRADDLLGPADPDGRARSLGAAPDAGAFEFPGQATPTTTSTTTTTTREQATPPSQPSLPGAPADDRSTGTNDAPGLASLPAGVTPPVLGRTAVLDPQGTVLVRPPGARGYRALAAADDLPLGTIVDARRGAVRLSTALPAGHQTGTFTGGRFEVRQARANGGVTDLILRGGDFSSCREAGGRAVARSAARRRGAVRRLWGRDRGGRFRTRGRSSVATVRGTAWLTEDRCEGTLVRVTEGAVAVRDLRPGGATKLVRAGGQRLVKARR